MSIIIPIVLTIYLFLAKVEFDSSQRMNVTMGRRLWVAAFWPVYFWKLKSQLKAFEEDEQSNREIEAFLNECCEEDNVNEGEK